MDAPAIEVRGLVKRYGRVEALAGIDLVVGRGTVFGLLGANGAGKTTLVKVLLGLVRPTAGSARLHGHPAGDPAARRDVGYLPENLRLPPYLTARQAIARACGLQGLAPAALQPRAEQLLERLALADRADEPLRGFSKGMRQRLGLLLAILHEPALVVLDEPTDGVDPRGRRVILRLIEEQRARGAAVLVNSHLLHELEDLCDEVAILDGGRVRHRGPVAALVTPPTRYRLTLAGPPPAELPARPLAADGDRLDVELDSPEQLAALVAAARPLAVAPLDSGLERLYLSDAPAAPPEPPPPVDATPAPPPPRRPADALRPWRALLVDSLRETLDQRSLHILVALAALLALAVAGTHFEPASFGSLLTTELPAIRVQLPGAPARVYHTLLVDDVTADGDRFRVRLRVESHRIARELMGALRARGQVLRGERAPDPFDVPPVGEGPMRLDDMTALLRDVCDAGGYGFQQVAADGDGWLLTLSPPRIGEVVGGGTIHVLFGAAEIDATVLRTRRSYFELLMVGQGMVVDWLAGVLGMAIAVVFTAGFLPRRLRAGAVEPLLARPLRRSTVFWATYLGGLFYVAALTAALVGGTFLVVGLRTGFWNWGYLLTIPSVTAMFAVLHAVSVFWGTVTRSATTAILMTLLTWAVCFAVNLVRTAGMLLEISGLAERPELQLPAWLLSTVEVGYWVLPSPTDFDYLHAWCVAQGPISEALRDRFLASSGYLIATSRAPLHASIASSLAFAVVVLLAARWIFCRRDL